MSTPSPAIPEAERPQARPVTLQRYAARVVVVDPDEHVLLFKLRNSRSGNEWWSTPGGGLNPGEKSIAGAARELKEETGLVAVDLQGPVWDADHWYRAGADLVHQRERFFLLRVPRFTPEMGGMDPIEAGATIEARWWSVPEMLTTSERIYPRGIGDLVTALLRDGVPDRPIRLARGSRDPGQVRETAP